MFPWESTNVTRLVSVPNPLPGSLISFATTKAAPLGVVFAFAFSSTLFVSAANATFTSFLPLASGIKSSTSTSLSDVSG